MIEWWWIPVVSIVSSIVTLVLIAIFGVNKDE